MASAIRFVLLLVLSGGFVYSQVDRASLNGTVTDSSGAVVPRARVEINSPDTGFKREVLTGPAGVYNATGLPIGTYDLRFSRAGFRTVEVKGIQLYVGQTRTVDANLEVGAITAQVEVQAAATAVQQNNAAIGGVVAAQQVRSLPLPASIAPGARAIR